MFDTIDDVIAKVTSSNAGYLTPPVEKYSTLSAIGAAAVNLVIGVGFAFGIVSIAYSMIVYITSGGNPEKTKTAWNAFLYGVIASMVALATIAIKVIIVNAFGVTDTNLVGTPTF